MADEFRPDEEDRIVPPEYAEPERYGRRGRRIMTGLVAVAAVLGFGVVLVYAYNKGREDGTSKVPPVIQAQEGPTKVRPDSPGGMKVPNRDKEVFSRLETEKPEGRVERLLPVPEKPMTPPPPLPVEADLNGVSPSAGTAAPDASSSVAIEAPPAVAAPKVVKELPVTPPKAPEPPPAAKSAKTEPAPKPLAAKAPVPKPAVKPIPKAVPKPAARTASAGSYRIQISALRSRSAVRKSWDALKKRHSDLLGKLSLSIETITLSGGRGTYYRMQAGPLSSNTQAAALCDSLKKRKQSCIVVKR